MLGNNTIYAELSDEQLVVEIVKDGNTQLFGSLYDRYVDLVFNKCLSFVESKEEAQDMTQDIFVKLFVKLKSFNGESKFKTWFYSLVYNFCVNYVERKVSKLKNNTSLKDEEEEAISEQEVSDNEIYQMKTKKLIKALNMISADSKAILLMKYQDDFTVKDLSEILTIGESAVKMRLNRSKSKLIKLYNQL